MKKLSLFILAMLVSVAVSARTNITGQELMTVNKLMDWNIVEKVRSPLELNQPLSAIDAMSMQIKTIHATNKYIEQMIEQKTYILEQDVYDLLEINFENDRKVDAQNEKLEQLNLELKALEKKNDEMFWWNVGITILAVVINRFI